MKVLRANLRRSALALLSAPLLICLGRPAPTLALVGPAVPDPSAESQVVMVLTAQRGRAGFCTASVLAADVVLTAAHCVPPEADLRIHFRDRAGAPILLGVAAIARHPLYRADAARRRERSIDLALARLAAPLPARFTPMTLAAAGPIAIGERFRILGYGVTRESAGETGGVLRAGVVAARAPLSNALLWATDPTGRGLGACSGDSGAPILSLDDRRLVAVVDWATGAGTRQCGALTQAALVAPQRAWIDRIMLGWRK